MGWRAASRERVSYRCKRPVYHLRCLCILFCMCRSQHCRFRHGNSRHWYHIHRCWPDMNLCRCSTDDSRVLWWFLSLPVHVTLGAEAVLVYPVLQVQTTALLDPSWEQIEFPSHPPFCTWQVSATNINIAKVTFCCSSAVRSQLTHLYRWH